MLIRTGWWEAHGPDSTDGTYFDGEPGITDDAAAWLAARDVALVGADNYAVEQQTDEPGFPAHLVLLHQHGVPLIENLDLAGLAAALADTGRSTFLLRVRAAAARRLDREPRHAGGASCDRAGCR